MQSERAVESEAIERACLVCRLRGDAGGQTILALVQERSGFLSAQRFDDEAQPVLKNLQLGGGVSVNCGGNQWQSLEFAHARVVAFDDRERFELFDQNLR